MAELAGLMKRMDLANGFGLAVTAGRTGLTQRVRPGRIILSAVLVAALLNGCANAPKKLTLKDKEPIYLQTSGKDSYHFSLLVQRKLAVYQVALARDRQTANTLVSIQGPSCSRYVVFVDEAGQRRDFQLQCTLDYQVTAKGASKPSLKSSLIASMLLARHDNLNVYLKREEQVNQGLRQDLAEQLVLVLATSDLED